MPASTNLYDHTENFLVFSIRKYKFFNFIPTIFINSDPSSIALLQQISINAHSHNSSNHIKLTNQIQLVVDGIHHDYSCNYRISLMLPIDAYPFRRRQIVIISESTSIFNSGKKDLEYQLLSDLLYFPNFQISSCTLIFFKGTHTHE